VNVGLKQTGTIFVPESLFKGDPIMYDKNIREARIKSLKEKIHYIFELKIIEIITLILMTSIFLYRFFYMAEYMDAIVMLLPISMILLTFRMMVPMKANYINTIHKLELYKNKQF